LAEVTVRRGALLLDSGAISAIADGNPEARAVLVRARNEGRQVAIPAAVLAEVVTDRPDHALVDLVIKSVDEELPLSPERARQAGILRARAWRLRQASGHRRKDDRPPSAVDALVMAEAVAAGTAVILTSDPDDLELLRDGAGLSKDQVEIIGV
jgi:predicted nucleic acid-binding protein